jgi:SAM-dependent methyltransferase
VGNVSPRRRPEGPSSQSLLGDATIYTSPYFFPDIPPGGFKDRILCENWKNKTFVGASFDLVVTSGEFEHFLDPARGFSEIARTLRPDGTYVFTVPWFFWKQTLVRATRGEEGKIRHLEPTNYHGNPIDEKGSLVVAEWGWEPCDFIYRTSVATTTAILIRDMSSVLAGEFYEVFISSKPTISMQADHRQVVESDRRVRTETL